MNVQDFYSISRKVSWKLQNDEAGYVWINSTGCYLGAHYVGWEASGLGQEECFEELMSYTQIKNVNMRW